MRRKPETQRGTQLPSLADFSRRKFFGLLCAPAVVRAGSLMPIRVFEPWKYQLIKPTIVLDDGWGWINPEIVIWFERNISWIDRKVEEILAQPR